ncbi:MAG: YegS/Rv2252/BmrU family lipid kinase [Clostridiales Family XIII bacterium]|jgi:YegS/Rv2252/BmrU family lipid kinase|nr:YegS/Rv2252/BmrU family lipid kinase [Clostridiales Family XIII bacterium]
MSYEKVLLFYNPLAGNGVIVNNLDKIIATFQKKRKVLVPVRIDKGIRLDNVFAEFGAHGFSRVIAAGGDGTVHAVVGSMVKYGVDVPLALLPAGTANDLARYFNMPTSFKEMLRIAASDDLVRMDVGLANGRPFANVLAAGALVDASQKTDPLAKNALGLVAYYLQALSELPKIRPIPVKVTLPDEVVETDMNAILILNGRGAGGFRAVVPHSVINDGLLEVMLVHNVPFVDWGPLALSLLMGQHENNKYISFYSASSVKIESDEDILTDLDGEIGVSLPVDVSVLPSRIEICVPEDWKAAHDTD